MKHILLAAILCPSILLTSCGGSDVRQKDVYIGELTTQVQDLKKQNTLKDQRIRELTNQKPRVVQAPAADPSASVRDALAGSGADVSYRNGEIVISLNNEILFRSGSATLTSSAKSSLAQVAKVIKSDFAKQFIRVDGHTDNQPIRRTKKTWSDNWHLAGGRARAVLQELVRKGVDLKKVGFAGYADQRPLTSNKTKAGRSKNRRVEIIVLPAQK